MNLRDLEYFDASARLGSFSAAAEFCHVSQPALSMQLRKLEDQLGVTLFERAGRNVQLTNIGAELLGPARKLLGQWQTLQEMARESTDPYSKELSLGAFPTLAPYILPRLLPSVVAAYPKLRLQLLEAKTPVLIEQLESAQLDLALLALPVDSADLEQRVVFSEPFLLAVPPSHPLAAQESVQLEQLTGEKLLLLEDGHCLRDQALSVCQLAGARERSQYRATSLETLRNMVAIGRGITLMPACAVPTRADEVQASGIRYLPFAQSPPQRSIALVWRRSATRGELFEALAGLLREAVGD